MNKEEIQSYKNMPQVERTVVFRNVITQLAEFLKEVEGAKMGKEHDEYCPLKHTFGDGFYMREIFCPKDNVFVTKIHKKENPIFLMKGRCTIITEDGAVDWEAPVHSVTKPGTQRVIRTWEDCIFVTVHATEFKELEKIEEQLIAKDFNDPAISIEFNDKKNITQ